MTYNGLPFLRERDGPDQICYLGIDDLGAYALPDVGTIVIAAMMGILSVVGQAILRGLDALPPGLTVLGIDEKTALIMDIHAGTGQVMGQGGISLLKKASYDPFGERYLSGEQFPLSKLGPLHLPEPEAGLPEQVWQAALEAAASTIQSDGPPDSVLSLVEAREAFRRQKDRPAADHLRKKILDLGWVVSDTPDGPALDPADDRPN
jgi:hypothetical protein